MKARLLSDFRDYYDHMFDLSGVPFARLSTGGLSRPEMLAFLESLGLPVPAYGRVNEFIGAVAPVGARLDRIVVYTHERMHRGEGKILTTLGEAYEQHPFAFMSRHVDGSYRMRCPLNPQHASHCSTSLRYLQVGDRKFWLEYWSDTDWRSNCGEGGVEVLCEEARGRGPVPLPLYAIDFVLSRYRWQEPLAVDFNSAPGLAGTGLEEIMTATEVVDAIKRCL